MTTNQYLRYSQIFLQGGGLTRVFWNGIYGPQQLSTGLFTIMHSMTPTKDVDIFLLDKADVIRFEELLMKKYPETRWSVHASTHFLIFGRYYHFYTIKRI